MKLSKNKPFKILIILTCIFLCLFVVTIFAHPGNTDSKGGHYNRSTGVYHYHHGEPEHQHKNGKCPYEDNSLYHIISSEFEVLFFIIGMFGLQFIGYKSYELLNDLFTTTFRMDKESSKIIAYILSIIISIISLIILIKILSFF